MTSHIQEAEAPLPPQVTVSNRLTTCGEFAEVIDPDSPPWGVGSGLLTWFANLAMVLFLPSLIVAPYVVYVSFSSGNAITPLAAATSSTGILIQITAMFPVHILSFLVVWLVVTGRGRRPFWKSLGWSWGRSFGPWTSAGLAVLLFAVAALITHMFGGEETQIDQIIRSSLAARYVTAVLAGLTGPFVEELVFRGVLYSSVRKSFGMVWAVTVVSVLFAGVHVLQYYNNIGVIIAVSVLSVALTLVRAMSGRLLPCFIIHVVFNGIQVVAVVIEPHLDRIRHYIETLRQAGRGAILTGTHLLDFFSHLTG